MQKILITGASGMLGYTVADKLAAQKKFNITGSGKKNIHSSFNYIKANLLNDKELNYLLESVKPDVIIHCAANINLNDCELNKDAAYKLHVDVSGKLASYNPGRCRIIYISTDSIFNGIKGNFTVPDNPEPCNYYALSKFEGEKAIMHANKNFVIIRTNMYGLNHTENGNSLFEWLYKNLSTHQTITGYNNIFFNPLYTGQLADVIIMILEAGITGIYHAGCKEYISKYQFALLIAEAFALDISLINNGVYNDASDLKRPKNTTLNTDALSKLLKKEYSIKDGINQLKHDFFQQKNGYA